MVNGADGKIVDGEEGGDVLYGGGAWVGGGVVEDGVGQESPSGAIHRQKRLRSPRRTLKTESRQIKARTQAGPV